MIELQSLTKSFRTRTGRRYVFRDLSFTFPPGTNTLVRNGDWSRLDVEARELELEVPEEELARRRAGWQPPVLPHTRGYYQLYTTHVLQADQGADFDFLVGKSGVEVTRESH